MIKSYYISQSNKKQNRKKKRKKEKSKESKDLEDLLIVLAQGVLEKSYLPSLKARVLPM